MTIEPCNCMVELYLILVIEKQYDERKDHGDTSEQLGLLLS